MKYKTTQSEVKNGYYKIINIGYCHLQNLLQYENPKAYTSGVYGWNADIYEIEGRHGVAIVTGYRPFGNVQPDYRTIKKFDKKGEEIQQSYYKNGYNYEKTKARARKWLQKFIDEVIED